MLIKVIFSAGEVFAAPAGKSHPLAAILRDVGAQNVSVFVKSVAIWTFDFVCLWEKFETWKRKREDLIQPQKLQFRD